MKSSWISSRRLALAAPVAGLLALVAVPAAASTAATPSPSPSASPSGSPTPDPSLRAQTVAQAQQQLQQAQAAQKSQDTALAQAQQNLANVQASLTSLQARIDQLDGAITDDRNTVQLLDAEVASERVQLGEYVRAAYEQNNGGGFLFIFSATSLPDLLARAASANHVSQSGADILNRIEYDQSAAQLALQDVQRRQSALAATREQLTTTQDLLQVELSQVKLADQQAQQSVAQAQSNLSAAKAGAALQALSGAGPTGVVYAPVPGVNFTIDTDLTQPSGETADRLNAFLQGTALQGLGPAYIQAEQTYHVSARYLVAHSIEESAFGTSQIAQDKHNLFGYGANDANPYNDAVSFPSFSACILFVAQKVAENYLSPTGPYYHGPTLRGMNVDYASDPNWADNIARIANSFP